MGPKLNTVLDMQPYQSWVQGDEHLLDPLSHVSQDTIGLLATWAYCWLTFSQEHGSWVSLDCWRLPTTLTTPKLHYNEITGYNLWKAAYSRTQLVFACMEMTSISTESHRSVKRPRQQTTEKIAMDVMCVTTHGAKRSFSISKVDDKKQSFSCRIYFGWRLIQFAKPYFLIASYQYILWTEYKNPLAQCWKGTVENTVTLKWYFWKMKTLC